jgi:hypothetical protein
MKHGCILLCAFLLTGCADQVTVENRAAVQRVLSLSETELAQLGKACDAIIQAYVTNNYVSGVTVYAASDGTMPDEFLKLGAKTVTYWEHGIAPVVFVGFDLVSHADKSRHPFFTWSRQVDDNDQIVQYPLPKTGSFYLRDPEEEQDYCLEVLDDGTANNPIEVTP